MANAPPNQPRNLKPSAPQPGGPYSTSPSQLTLTGDPSTLANAYGQPQPSYAFPTHDPSAYGFQQPPHAYRTAPHQQPPPPLQTQQQQQQLPQHHGGPPQSQGGSSNLPRKRRPSEVVDPSASGGPGAAANSFMAPPSGMEGEPGGQQDASSSGLGLQGGAGGLGGIPQGQGQLPSPVAKKSRTNTPWTPAEEQRLKTLRDVGSSWTDIAKMFPTRTEGSVKKHWYKDMHYAEFAADESAALLQAMKEYENNKWKVIGQKLGKPAKACEQFAKEQGWKV